jgi:hypothetical protein
MRTLMLAEAMRPTAKLTAAATLLLLACSAASAEAQGGTATMRIPDRFQLKTGKLRQLVCRGAPGLDIRPDPDSAPGNAYVAMVLRYRRTVHRPGDDFRNLDPGSCSWNPLGDFSVKSEPGIVRFHVDRRGSTFIPNPRTLALWMNDPAHFWSFYVDDVTQYSGSHGAHRVSFRAADADLKDRNRKANAGLAVREELRCRGGAGLSFGRTGTPASNVVGMVLRYGRAPAEAGPLGRGLAPGTCAWATRTDRKEEPGRVAFATAGNAQLKQIQSGSAVDRSTTAAERWPDAQTIPVYLADPQHYWTFTIQMSNTDSALGHAAWKPQTGDAPAVTPPPSSGTVPTATTAAPTTTSPATPYSPGAGTRSSIQSAAPSEKTGAGAPVRDRNASSATAIAAQAPLRVDGVNLVLDRFTIQFSGRPNASPTVLYSTEKPVREPSTGRWFFPNGVIQGSGAVEGGFRAEVSGGSAQGFRANYVAWSRLPPARGTLYHYIVTIPPGVDAKEEQLTGQVTTLAQHARVVFTQIGVVSTRNEDMSFRFFAVPEGSEAVSRDLGPGLEWKTGYHSLDGQVLELPNAPDRLRVLVWGGDFDGALGGQLMPAYDWNLPVKNGGVSDQNIVRHELTIGTSPTERFLTFPFVLEPVYRGFLMFTVHGRVEVTRR